MEIDIHEVIRQARVELDQLPGENDVGIKRGYKFLEHADHHLERITATFDQLDPPRGGRVFEIGPGCCFLLHMCRQRQCEVQAVDVKMEYFTVYQIMRRLLGFESCVSEYRVRPKTPIPFDGKFDRIVATAIVFDREWDIDEHLFFVEDCLHNLKPNGVLVLSFNEHTVLNPEVIDVYRSIASFPKKYMAVIPRSVITSVCKKRSLECAKDPCSG